MRSVLSFILSPDLSPKEVSRSSGDALDVAETVYAIAENHGLSTIYDRGQFVRIVGSAISNFHDHVRRDEADVELDIEIECRNARLVISVTDGSPWGTMFTHLVFKRSASINTKSRDESHAGGNRLIIEIELGGGG